MEKVKFNLSDFNLESRLSRLSKPQAQVLADVFHGLEKTGESWLEFVLPLTEFGLSSSQILGLVERIPEGFPIDHRQIYFDFRLGRWMKHIEPPTISESLEEYLENSESPNQGMVYLKGQWQAFLERH